MGLTSNGSRELSSGKNQWFGESSPKAVFVKLPVAVLIKTRVPPT